MKNKEGRREDERDLSVMSNCWCELMKNSVSKCKNKFYHNKRNLEKKNKRKKNTQSVKPTSNTDPYLKSILLIFANLYIKSVCLTLNHIF